MNSVGYANLVSIALGVYPQAAMKPLHLAHAAEPFFFFSFSFQSLEPTLNSSDFTLGHAGIKIRAAF